MTTRSRNAAQIAKTIKFLRESKKMKAETLAQLARLTVRSIERAESGRHVPSEETLTRIASAFGTTVGIFDSVDTETLRRELEDKAKKTLLVPTSPMEKPGQVLDTMTDASAYMHDFSAIKDERVLELAAALVEAIRDYGDSWEDLPLTEQLRSCHDLVDLANEIVALGYQPQMGAYTAVQLMPNKNHFKIKIVLIAFLPKDHPGRYAMITLPSDMRTLPEDRPKFEG
jgi:transcriptional regulator with XRE-family HTH domain